MKLTFEEKTMRYTDGVQIEVELGKFIDEYMASHKNKETKMQLGERLGISHIDVAIVADRVRKFGVNLPELRIQY
jgi:hypothetical protein